MANLNRKYIIFLLFINVFNQLPEFLSASNFKLVCYYTNWAIYRPSLAKFTPQNINPYLCTHLIYAFAGLTRRFEVKPFDAYNDIQQGNYNKFIDLKKYNPELKTMIAIGGWNEGSKKFSEMVSEDKNRKKFVKSVMKFLREHRFDGLDLDWEYPTFRDGSHPEDKEGYAMLVEELREAFDNEQLVSGRKKLLLSMAVPAGRQYIDQGYDIPVLAKNLDFFNLLTYDYYTTGDGLANHHSALYRVGDYEDWDHHGQLNVDYTVNYYLDLGVPAAKINVGVPSYGRAFALEDPEEYQLGAAIKGSAEAGPATREAGYLAYFEICQNVLEKDWEVKKEYPDAVGPYAIKDDQWVSYDDEAMVIRKAKYVIENKLGGLMFWSLDTDDFRDLCGNGNSPLITAARKTLFSKKKTSKPTTEDDYEQEEEEEEVVTTKKPKRTTTTTEATTTTTEPEHLEEVPEDILIEDDNEEVEVTVRPNARSDFGSKTRGRRKSPRGRSRTEDEEVEEEEEEPEAPPTPEPPTTPDPGPQFECKDEGFFSNPKDCRKYFWCLDSGPADLGIVPHHFTCPSGLFFNTNSDSCDYKDNVNCKLDSSLRTTTTTRPSKRPTTRTTARPTKRTTTTTEAEEIEEEPTTTAKPEENVAQLLQLIKKLGGVEQVQKHLGIEGQSDEPQRPTPRARIATTEEPSIASIAEEKPTRQRTTRRRTTTTPEPEPEQVTTRARRPPVRALRRKTTTTEEPIVEEEVTTTRVVRKRPITVRSVRRTTTAEPEEEDVLVDNSRQSTTVQKFQEVEEDVKIARQFKPTPSTTPKPTPVPFEPEEDNGDTHTFRQTRIPRLFRYRSINRTGVIEDSVQSDGDDVTIASAPEEEEAPASTKKPAAAKQLKSILDALNEEPTTDHQADQSSVVTTRNSENEEEISARESTNVEQEAESLPFENIGTALDERSGVLAPEIVDETIVEHQMDTETASAGIVDVVDQSAPAQTTPFEEYYYDEELTDAPTTTTTEAPTTTTTEEPTTTLATTRRPLVRATRRPIRPIAITTTTTPATTQVPITRATPRATTASPRAFRPTTTRFTTTTPAAPKRIRLKQADGAVIDEEFEGLTLDENGTLECLEQGVYPHPTDCDKYVSCVHEQTKFTAYPYKCPVGQLYDEFTGRCLEEESVDCVIS